MVKSLCVVLVRTSALIVALGIGATCGRPAVAQTTSGERPRERCRRSSTASCSSATPRSPARRSPPTASTSPSSSRSRTRATSGSSAPSEPFDAAKPITAETKRPIPGYLLEPRRQVHPLRPGPGRRRELQRLRRRSRRCAAAGPDVPAARNLTDAKGVRAQIYAVPRSDPDVDLRRPQRSRRGLARSLQGQDLDRRAHAAPQEHRAHRRLGLRLRRQAAPGDALDRQRRHRNPARRPTPASPRSTPATCSRPAARCSSTRTASASTWQTNKGDADLDPPRALRSGHAARKSSSNPIR